MSRLLERRMKNNKDNKMNIEKTQKQIEELQAQIDSERARRAELAKLGPEFELADTLHAVMCHFNHADGCGWHYESWDGPINARQNWVNKAKRIIETVGAENTNMFIAGLEALKSF